MAIAEIKEVPNCLVLEFASHLSPARLINVGELDTVLLVRDSEDLDGHTCWAGCRPQFLIKFDFYAFAGNAVANILFVERSDQVFKEI